MIGSVLPVLSASALICSCAQKGGPPLPPPEVVPYVDLEKHTGRWYQMASYPNRFQMSGLSWLRVKFYQKWKHNSAAKALRHKENTKN